jgi:hypothetical protein
MAVEIIPKPIKKTPSYQKRLFYFSILLLLGIFLSYFVLISFEKKSENALSNLEEALSKGETPEMKSLEEKIKNDRRKIKDISPLIQSHLFPSKILEFFEKNTYPNVFFSEINLNSLNSTADLSGECDNFIILGQQLAVFEKNPLVAKVSLKQVSVTKEGKVKFSLVFSFNPQISKY